MYYKIWKETDMPSCGEHRLLCATTLPEKYPDMDSAVKALAELAENNFYFTKYRLKHVESIEKENDGKYVVHLKLRTITGRMKDVTETYYIPRWHI